MLIITTHPTATVLPQLNVTLTGSGGTLTEGQNHMLTCTASGGGSMAYTYMWLKDGSLVSGQTSPTYSFSPLEKADSGRYSCRVRVGFTTMTTSREVTITVVGESCTAIATPRHYTIMYLPQTLLFFMVNNLVVGENA